jgi:hypothetical protein
VASAAGGAPSVARVEFTTEVGELKYTAVPLPTGFRYGGDALDINTSGAAVGWIDDYGTRRAAIWPTPTTYNYLDTSTSQANAINDDGVVVGQSLGTAVIWSNGTKQTILADATAVDVNQSGLVAVIPGYGTIPTLWQNGTLTQLPPCSSSLNPTLCRINKVNDAGQGFGTGVSSHAGETHAEGYHVVINPPAPPGQAGPAYNHTADAFNNSGQFAGSARAAGTALYLGSNLLAAEVGLQSRINQPVVRGLNNAGDLLVFEFTTRTPFILRDGRVYRVRLPVLGTEPDDVHAINDAGWIAARIGSQPYLLKPAGK